MQHCSRYAAFAAGLVAALAAGIAPCAEPYPSTYRPAPSPPTLIRGATLLTGTGARIDHGEVLIEAGRIVAVGHDLTAPAGARILEAQGRWVTPGLIDIHSHLGVAASPSVSGLDDGNEATSPITPNVWAEHSVWPQDPGFETALEGGVTTLQILPGSANLIGGRSVVLKNVPAATVQGMKFPGAPYGLKMACGENPKRVYGGHGQAPSTRMGSIALMRQAFLDARVYQQQWDRYAADRAAYEKRQDKKQKPPTPPQVDLKNETLAGVLRGDIRVHVHCYRADEMANVLDLAAEMGFKIAAFHHGVEAYKIADLLAAQGVCGALWADWWGFKMEAFDGIQENLALVDHAPGGCAIVHSDSEEGIQRLNQEAAKGMARGARMGFAIPPEHAITWLTANPAKAMGILDRVGTLEPGKMADVAVWNRNPFSVYALVEQVLIDGVMQFDREHPRGQPRSDFLLGQAP